MTTEIVAFGITLIGNLVAAAILHDISFWRRWVAFVAIGSSTVLMCLVLWKP